MMNFRLNIKNNKNKTDKNENEKVIDWHCCKTCATKDCKMRIENTYICCGDYNEKPKTHYNDILNMSIEELAKEFARASIKTIDAIMELYNIKEYEINNEGFINCWLEYLKQEIED